MRDITVSEVDIGCIACNGERCTSNGATLFVAGVLAGLAKDELAFCTPHFQGFQRAMAGIAGASHQAGDDKEGT